MNYNIQYLRAVAAISTVAFHIIVVSYNYDYNCSSSIGPTSGSGAHDRDYYEMGNRTASIWYLDIQMIVV